MSTYLRFSFLSRPHAQITGPRSTSGSAATWTDYVDVEDITLLKSHVSHVDTWCDMYAHAVLADRSSAAGTTPNQLSYISSGVAVVYSVVDPSTQKREFARFQLSSGLNMEDGKVQTELTVTENLSDDHIRKLLEHNAFCNLSTHSDTGEKVSVCELEPVEMPESLTGDDFEEGEVAEEINFDASQATTDDHAARIEALKVKYEKYHESTTPGMMGKRYALCRDKLDPVKRQPVTEALGKLHRFLESPNNTDRYRDLMTEKIQQGVEELECHLKAAEAKKSASDPTP